MSNFKSVYSALADKPIFTVSDWFKDENGKDLITADLYCTKCATTKTFVGKAYSQNKEIAVVLNYIHQQNESYQNRLREPSNIDVATVLKSILNEAELRVDDVAIIKLSCPTCDNKTYIAYAFQSEQRGESHEKGTRYHTFYRVQKIGEYPSQETSRLLPLNKYLTRFPAEHAFLVKSIKAYQLEFGAGAMVYIRKAYESLLFGILDAAGVARPYTFKNTLKVADETAHIVPAVLTNKAYGLFGEISDIVHGDTEDAVGMEKYEDLRDVFLLILDNIIEQERTAAIAARIRTDNTRSGGN